MMMEDTIRAIEAQQEKAEMFSAPWVVGEQLKDLARENSHNAELLLQDLQNKDMTIFAAEKKIKAYADKHKKGSFAFVAPQKAEQILREFYGLGAAAAQEEPAGDFLNLADFL